MMPLNEISSDGSDRIFQRIEFNNKKTVLIKPSKNSTGIAESASYYSIGSHLCKKGIPVPEIYKFDKDSGEILVEDLGDTKFFDVVSALNLNENKTEVFNWYEKIIKLLASMQVSCSKDFNINWCYDTPYYNEDLAFNRECLYFINSFLFDYLGFSSEKIPFLTEELSNFSKKINKFEAYFFLHRDFQSRNIMIHKDSLKIIDFQGGRLGPLGYDISSLLIDPYVQIDRKWWPDIIKIYLEELNLYQVKRDYDVFWNEFKVLGILRNLQILGAFSFLTLIKKKFFFNDYIRPALDNLKYLLSLEREPALDNLCRAVNEIQIN